MRHDHIFHQSTGDGAGSSGRGWLALLFGLWGLACLWLIAAHLPQIATLRLPDSDDALRLLQVRDWLAGQGWFDLRQHRLDPPTGADLHWTRMVDLPIAAVIRSTMPIVATGAATRIAVTLVPLLTLGAAMLLAALIARRLIAPAAWWWAPLILLAASPAVGMMTPLRIDHHGWQIVSVLALILGLVMPDGRRGGLLAGGTIALSLAIGVEMLPCLAAGFAIAAIRWVADPAEAKRLRWLCVTAAIGAVAALIAFVPPPARWGNACDALSSAHVAPLLAAFVVLAGGSLRTGGRGGRSAVLALAGMFAVALLAGGGGGRCLTDPYHAIDPAARTLWLDHVVEAPPLWRQTTEVALASLILPLTGMAGAAWMLSRSSRAGRAGWATMLVFSIVTILLMLASTRAAVIAQALAVPGAAAIGHAGRMRLTRSPLMIVRVAGSVLLFLCVTALGPRLAVAAFAGGTKNAPHAVDCLSPAAIAPLNALPAGTVLTPVDAAAALLLHGHHRGVAGPYHRNGAAIADVMQAWGGLPDQAEAIVRRRGVAYVAMCAGLSEGTLHDRRAPWGLHARLSRNDPPGWLRPIRIAGTPWRVWALRADATAE